MKRLPQIALRQQRGSWLAKVLMGRDIALLRQERIAVIRDWEDEDFLHWTATPPRYTEPAGHQNEGGPAWWLRPEHSVWRQHLHEDAVVWVRKGLRDETVNGTVGRSAGVWRIVDVSLSEHSLTFTFAERLGDAK